MRPMLLLLAVFVVGGCAETYKGPRVVHYSPDRFYIRHAPLVDSVSAVDELASIECLNRPGKAKLLDQTQYYFFDLRWALYGCNPPAPIDADTDNGSISASPMLDSTMEPLPTVQ